MGVYCEIELDDVGEEGLVVSVEAVVSNGVVEVGGEGLDVPVGGQHNHMDGSPGGVGPVGGHDLPVGVGHHPAHPSHHHRLLDQEQSCARVGVQHCCVGSELGEGKDSRHVKVLHNPVPNDQAHVLGALLHQHVAGKIHDRALDVHPVAGQHRHVFGVLHGGGPVVDGEGYVGHTGCVVVVQVEDL